MHWIILQSFQKEDLETFVASKKDLAMEFVQMAYSARIVIGNHTLFYLSLNTTGIHHSIAQANSGHRQLLICYGSPVSFICYA